MSMFKITTAVRSILLSSHGMEESVKKNIFPIIAPENTEGDYITYQRDGFKQDHTKMGVATQTPLVNLYIVSNDYDRSQDIAERVFNLISGRFENPYMDITLEDSTEEYADGKFIQVLQFSIKTI